MPHPGGQWHVAGVTIALACIERVSAGAKGKIAQETVFAMVVMLSFECCSVSCLLIFHCSKLAHHGPCPEHITSIMQERQRLLPTHVELYRRIRSQTLWRVSSSPSCRQRCFTRAIELRIVWKSCRVERKRSMPSERGYHGVRSCLIIKRGCTLHLTCPERQRDGVYRERKPQTRRKREQECSERS